MRRRIAALALVLGPALALAAAMPAVAGTSPAKSLPAMPTSQSRSTTTVPDLSSSAVAGFAAVSSGGTVDHFTAYSSTGGVISVINGSAGEYAVTFAGLTLANGGDVQITDPGGTGTCAVNSWGGSPNLEVDVNCYNLTGTLTEQDFNVLVTQPHTTGTRPNGVFDYDWVNKANGRLTGIYQFNSAHRANSVRRVATGHYIVTMPGPGPAGAAKGTVKVSAYGTGDGSCQVTSLHAVRIGEQIGVACFAATGIPVNRDFTIVYTRGNNLMGQNGKLTANALANGRKELYQPPIQFDSKRGARVTIVHLDRGVYEVLFPGTSPTHHFSGGFGDVQFTPVAGAYRLCGLALLPLHVPFALVDCTTATGTPANTSFTVQLVFN